MRNPLTGVALVMSLFAAAPASAENANSQLDPWQLRVAVDPATYARVIALLEQGKTDEAVEDLVASTILSDEQSARLAEHLSVAMRKRAEEAEQAALIENFLASLDPEIREDVLRLIAIGQKKLALDKLVDATGIPSKSLETVVAWIEHKLKAAGVYAPRQAESVDEVMAGLKESARDEIMQLVAERKKIPAIRILRGETGFGLRESKRIVDALMAREN